jgi:hypothetical protein
MNKFLGIVVLGLLWCNVGFAEMRLIENKHLGPGHDENHYYMLTTICVDGYKFVIHEPTYRFNETVTNMVQAFEERDGKSLPTKC